ncbi:hypothetical protein [Methanobrevibacter sp.]|uniref:hypothetical protein n=1 Tax=Methanobrevibacter sp. TaxID=66852 RepID=UPI00386D2E98
MEKLKQNLNDINNSISELESQIREAKIEAEVNVKLLTNELSQVRQDKKEFAIKNDFDSVQNCRRKENNLKFKIDAQWNKYSLLNSELSKLNKEKLGLEKQIKLEEDKIKRNNEIQSQIDKVLNNYKKTQNLKQAAIDSNINPNTVEHWYDWGKKNFNETYSYFYTQILEIDNYFKKLESQKLKEQMDNVIEAYKKTNSLKEASKRANVSYDTVQYWYEWGFKGFGKENTYFFKKIDNI